MAVLKCGMLAEPLIWTPTSPIFIKCHGLKSSRYKPSRLGVPTGAANCKERGVFNNPYSLFNYYILLGALGFLHPDLPLLPPFHISKTGHFLVNCVLKNQLLTRHSTEKAEFKMV